MGRSSKWLRKLLGVKKKSPSKEKAASIHQDNKEIDSTPTEKYVPALPMHHVQDSVLTAIPETESAYAEVEDADPKEIEREGKLEEVIVEEDLKQNNVYVTPANLYTAGKSEIFNATEEHAAIKIQKAFRRYLAYRAFRALKGLVRLQALVRGHAVRKQAAVSLRCVEAIVKVQANIRGFQVRESPEGLAVRKHLGPRKQDTNSLENLIQKNNPLKTRHTENLYDRGRVNEDSVVGQHKTYKQQIQTYAPTTHYMKNFSSDGTKESGWIWLELWTAYRPWASLSSTEKCISAPQTLKIVTEPVEAADLKAKSKRSNICTTSLCESGNSSSSYKPASESPSRPLKADVQVESSAACELSPGVLSLTVSPRLSAQTSPALLSPISQRCGTAVAVSPTPCNSSHIFSHASFESVEKNSSPSSDHVSLAQERKSMSKSEPRSSEKVSIMETPPQVSPTIPSYMATTKSSKAKVRSNNLPRQKADMSDRNFSTVKRRLALSGSSGKDSSEILRTQKWNSGVRTHSKAFTTSLKYARPQAV